MPPQPIDAQVIAQEVASVDAMLAQLHVQVGMDLRTELVMAFLPLLQETLRTLPPALEAGDADQVINLSHKLKGAALQLGAERLASGCREIELAGRQGLMGHAESSFGEVRQLSLGLLSGLRAH
ncbi:Hpt domain-containing protein [Chitiniphilus eburneus]|nr:Hpt domain-containing protein [Chitiniphilus eburneus]